MYHTDLRNGTFAGPYSGYAEFHAYRQRLFAQLDGAAPVSAADTFQRSPRAVRGWAVTPAVRPRPEAAIHGFTSTAVCAPAGRAAPMATAAAAAPATTPARAPTKTPVRAAAPQAAIDLTLSSDEEAAPAEGDGYVQRIAAALSRLSPTPLLDRLLARPAERDRTVRAFIQAERRAAGGLVPASPGLPALAGAAVAAVAAVWARADTDTVVSECGSIPLTVGDLRRMRGRTWLNDECINGYLELVVAAAAAAGGAPVHSFGTFFYAQLSTKGYGAVQRWTRRLDLFAQAMALVPVHLGMHWTMAAIDFAARRILYVDSFHAGNQACLDTLWAYLAHEHLDKRGTPWDPAGWQAVCLTEGVPRQANGYDCGVFACAFGECLARRAPFGFTQADMPYLRHRIAYELLTGSILPRDQ